MPAMLLPQQPSARATRPMTPAVPTPHVPAPQEKPSDQAAEHAPYVPAAPVAPAAGGSAAPPASGPPPFASDPSSKAPPGFTGGGILAAESATLVALDPVEDETTAPEPVAAPIETVGGSALLAKATKLVLRRGDLARVRQDKDKDAAIRIIVSSAVLVALAVLLGPVLVRLLSKLPVLSNVIEQLDAFRRYPGAFGMPWVLATFGALTAGGVVVAQMEARAHKLERRTDPTTRLNIALGGVVTLGLVGAALSLGRASGSLAGAASVTFFVITLLLIPVGKLPGARALAPQAPRAWGLVFVLAALGFAIKPSLGTAIFAVLALTQVRTQWAAISDGTQAADGPIDHTNRVSALIIVSALLIVCSVGMRATTLPVDDLKPSALDSETTLPGTERGPTIAPPTP